MSFGKSAVTNRIGKEKILPVFAILFLLSISLFAQDKQRPLPSEESFEPGDGIVDDTWDATKRNYARTNEQDTIKIYNEDGSLWYEFSLYPSSPLFFKKNPKSDFQPYALRIGGLFHLRLKAISKNWYEVVVNEETQATKFIPIDDPITAYLPLEFYLLNFHGYITFNAEKNPLREKPNGKVIDDNNNQTERCMPDFVRGEWIHVYSPHHTSAASSCYGWIRWKDDRKILIGFILNQRIVPEQ